MGKIFGRSSEITEDRFFELLKQYCKQYEKKGWVYEENCASDSKNIMIADEKSDLAVMIVCYTEKNWFTLFLPIQPLPLNDNKVIEDLIFAANCANNSVSVDCEQQGMFTCDSNTGAVSYFLSSCFDKVIIDLEHIEKVFEKAIEMHKKYFFKFRDVVVNDLSRSQISDLMD